MPRIKGTRRMLVQVQVIRKRVRLGLHGHVTHTLVSQAWNSYLSLELEEIDQVLVSNNAQS